MKPSDYQRVRLWAGITSIGTNLAIIWALAISSAWWAGWFPGTLSQIILLVVVAGGIALANLPFDALSGHAMETAAGRTTQSFRLWLTDWLRERMLFVCGLAFGFLFFWVNFVFVQSLALPLLGMAVLLAAVGLWLVPGGKSSRQGSDEKAFEAELLAELTALGVGHRVIQWFENGDVDSVNGYIRLNGTLCLATNVSRRLQPREAALLVAREEWFRRSRVWLLIDGIALAWLMLGFSAALWYPATSAVQAALGGSAVVTTWCFIALFVWPSLNRRWMRKGDFSLTRIAPPSEVRALLAKLQQLNATDIDLPRGKTTVFHPIPPLNERLKSLS